MSKQKYTMYAEDGKVTIQKAEYIEDGWYIEIIKDVITLYWIPLYGGQEQMIGLYETIAEAMEASEQLT